MYIWEKSPIFRLFLPLFTGITLALKTGYHSYWFIIIPVTLLIILIIHIRFRDMYLSPLNVWKQGLILTLVLISLSYSLVVVHNDSLHPRHYVKHLQKDDIIIARISEHPEEKTSTFKTYVKIKLIIHNNKQTEQVFGKAIVFIKKDSLSASLRYGDAIAFKNKLRLIDPPRNPGQFNYNRFLQFKQVYRQAYLDNSCWELFSKESGFRIYSTIIALRNQIVNLIREKINDPDAASVASALLVGYKTDLSDMVKESFSSTGAMHVLAVSGLHVGIIFLVFNSLFKFLKRGKYGKWVHFSLIFSILISYAVITGLSPSVSRAVLMFTFVLLGQSISRITNVYSSIMVSAIILLMFDPFLLTQVGFQLSYVAVLGIVSIQPHIYHLINKQPWYIDKPWGLIAVSLAAQISTFPLGLLYFNQFPFYFLISNLIVIPAAFIIIYIGLSFIVFHFTGLIVLSDFFGQLLEWSLLGLNYSILQIRNLPMGTIGGLFITETMAYIIYALIVSLLFFWIKRQKSYLFLASIFTLILISSFVIKEYSRKNQKRMVIYHVKNHTLMSFYQNGNIVLVGDSSIINDSTTLRYNTYRDVSYHGGNLDKIPKYDIARDFTHEGLMKKGPLLRFYNMDFCLLNRNFDNQGAAKEKIDLDYIILCQNPFVNFEFIRKNISVKGIIADASNKYFKVRKYETLAHHAGFDFMDIDRNGAVIFNLR